MQSGDGYRDGPPRRKSGLHWAWILVGVFLICGCGGIGLLGAILFPVFAQARMKGQQTRCLSNVKQIGIATVMYANDFDDRLPPGATWMDATEKYAEYPRIFACPAVSRPGLLTPRVGGKYGYAVNTSLSGKTAKSIKDPGKVIWVFESSDLARNATGDPSTSPAPNRHGPGRTEGYADGHAAFVKSASSTSGSR